MAKPVHTTPNGGVELPRALRDKLSKLVQAHGENQVMSWTGLSRSTLARSIAGLGVRRGTIAQLQQSLAAVEAAK